MLALKGSSLEELVAMPLDKIKESIQNEDWNASRQKTLLSGRAAEKAEAASHKPIQEAVEDVSDGHPMTDPAAEASENHSHAAGTAIEAASK